MTSKLQMYLDEPSRCICDRSVRVVMKQLNMSLEEVEKAVAILELRLFVPDSELIEKCKKYSERI